MSKKVAIVGAGFSGLAAIKSCLEVGLEPTAFEKDPWIGGLWKYTDLQEETEPRGCVAFSTVTNTSKHMTCYSDFPMPKEWPNYPRHELVLKYIQMYTERFRLEERIRFQTTVIAIEPCRDHSKTGRWEVHYIDDGKENEHKSQRMEEFDFVMVCSGINWNPRLPEIPGLDKFSGDVIHSKDYRTWKGFEGKRVVVIGLGNTAGDIACELSRHASQVYVSTRSGSLVISRLGDGGKPIDISLSRFINAIPIPLVRRILAWKVNSKISMANFGLQPTERLFSIINDELPHRIITGSVQVKCDVAEVGKYTVAFKDGTKVHNIDLIILATGYKFSFPFLSDSLLCQTERYIPLFKYVFPPLLDQGTLAFIGVVRVTGPVPVIAEVQTRWAVRVFVGEKKLPDCKTMMKDVKRRQNHLEANTFNTNRFYHLVRFISYTDEIASEVGIKPNIWKLLWYDPALALKCLFGPCIPAQYRLVGPGAWQGARDVIMGVQESMLCPLRTRKVPMKVTENGSDRKRSLFCVFIVFGLLILMSLILL